MSAFETTYLSEVAQSADPVMRHELACQLGDLFADKDKDSGEEAALIPIALRLCDDPIRAVRQAFADRLVDSPIAPRQIVFAQIGDCQAIAQAYLRRSPVLSDADLADIAKIADPARLEAIIERPQLDVLATRAIIDHAPRHICAKMLANPEARLDHAGFNACVEAHGRSARMRDVLLHHDDLPITLHAHLLFLVSDNLCKQSTDRQWLSAVRAEEITAIARERAVVDLAKSAPLEEIIELVRTLHECGKLTQSMILRAVCCGYMSFAAHALSCLARVPAARVYGFMRHGSHFGLSGLCARAGLMDGISGAMVIAVEIYQKLVDEGCIDDSEKFGQHFVEAIVTRVDRFNDPQRAVLLDYVARYGPDTSAKLAHKLVNDTQAAA